MPPRRRNRRIVDSDDDDDEGQNVEVAAAGAGQASNGNNATTNGANPDLNDEQDDADAMEEDLPIEGDRQDRYLQNRLRDEARFAAAQRSERVVDGGIRSPRDLFISKKEDVDMADLELDEEEDMKGSKPEPDYDDYDDGGAGLGAGRDSDSDGDEVVAEIDVFVNQGLANKLYLFQYPARTQDFAPSQFPRQGKIKPVSKMVEVNVPLDTDSEKYDRARGEELAEGGNETHVLGKSKGKAKMLDHQVYSSTPVPANATYFAGIIRDDGLHLSPVHGMVQLRPNLAYLNKSKEKSGSKANTGSDAIVPEEGSGQTRMLQVSLRKADAGENRDENQRRTLDHEAKRRAEEELWTTLNIHAAETKEAADAREALIIADMEVEDAQVAGSSATYLDEVAPRAPVQIRTDEDGKEEWQVLKGMPLAQVQAYPLPQQLKSIMVNGEQALPTFLSKSEANCLFLETANIIRFSKIREVVLPYYTDDRILEELPKVASLVRGCWVVRSSIIYKDRAAAARQHLLKMFSESEYVTRQQLIEKTRLPLPMATSMLQELAVLVPGKGWELRTGHDDEFIRQHEQLVSRLKFNFEKEIVVAERELAAKAVRRNSTSAAAKPSIPPSASTATTTTTAPVAAATSTQQHKRAPSAEAAKPAAMSARAPAPPKSTKGKEPAGRSETTSVPSDVTVFEKNPVSGSEYPVTGSGVHEQAKALARQAFTKHGVLKVSVLKSLIWARANDIGESFAFPLLFMGNGLIKIFFLN